MMHENRDVMCRFLLELLTVTWCSRRILFLLMPLLLRSTRLLPGWVEPVGDGRLFLMELRLDLQRKKEQNSEKSINSFFWPFTLGTIEKLLKDFYRVTSMRFLRVSSTCMGQSSHNAMHLLFSCIQIPKELSEIYNKLTHGELHWTSEVITQLIRRHLYTQAIALPLHFGNTSLKFRKKAKEKPLFFSWRVLWSPD